jgi:hypothetical protein
MNQQNNKNWCSAGPLVSKESTTPDLLVQLPIGRHDQNKPTASTKRYISKMRHPVSVKWVKLNLLVIILEFLSQRANGLSVSPQICQSSYDRLIYQLPSAHQCPMIPRLTTEPPVKVEWEIYRANTKLYNTNITVCRLILSELRFYTNFIGDKISTSKAHNILVDPYSCAAMIKTKVCSAGNLIFTHDSMWSTQNEVKVVFPYPILGSFTYQTLAVQNCFVYESSIASRYESPALSSPIGDVSNCDYAKGFCVIEGPLTLLWTPQRPVLCKYIKIANFSGELLGKAFLDKHIRWP